MLKSADQFRVNQLPPFQLGELAQEVLTLRSEGHDVIDLSQLNPNLGPPAQAVEKLVQASLQPHNHKYSSSQGIAKLRGSVSDWYSRRFSVNVSAENEIVITMGTKQGLSHLLFAVVSQGESILLPTPAYPIHTSAIALAGANCIGVPLPEEGLREGLLSEAHDDYFRRLADAYDASWPRPLMMIVSFPHNPTSLCVTPGFFQRLVDLAKEKGFYLVHDFAYADLGYDGYKTPSLLAAAGAKDVAVECCSFSKGMSMPGWRVGSCAGAEPLISALKKVKSYLDCGSFQPLQIAAIRAFECYDQTLAETVDIYRARRDVLAAGLLALGFELNIPKGSLFVWAKIPEKFRAAGSGEFARRILHEAHIAACPGIGFDAHADHFLRFALVEPEARIRSGLQQLKHFLSR